MDGLLWWLGWRPKVAVVLGLVLAGCFLAAVNSGILALVGFLAPIVLWFSSTRSIDRKWLELLKELEQTVKAKGQMWLHLAEGEFDVFLLREELGERSAFIDPARAYRFTAVYVTPSMVGAYSGTTYDTINRRLKPGSETNEIYFKQIAGVDYRPGEIEIKTPGSRPFLLTAPSEDMGHAIVGQIRSRLRTVHA